MAALTEGNFQPGFFCLRRPVIGREPALQHSKPLAWANLARSTLSRVSLWLDH